MECHSELSKAPPLTICDVQSDAESAIHTRPSSENVFTTPQKMYSAPFCRSSCTPECDDDIRPAIGMTFTDLNAAKDFYEAYAHHVGFSVRVGQHKTANGVITHKRFYCDREGFRQEQKGRCVWSFETPTEFEERWKEIMSEYGLEDDDWFSKRFSLRESWIPAYFKEIALSGLMRTTSSFGRTTS
ncbi:uncharacterized protein [Aegilops tauschii subsp. strangulata]|uniref:uncharacterized protein n=1 Tax=Aegilops tauschii subsp. strangulata TaxID=200361 RepID=UPI003CC844C7